MASRPARERYAELKRELARSHPDDRVAYYEGKRAFIESTVDALF